MGYAKTKMTESERKSIASALFQVTATDDSKGELHGLCPIHNEKNPSFSYNYRDDKYNCFSCGAGGDLIGLYSHVNGLDQKEGFKAFCRQYSIQSDNYQKRDTEKKPSSDDLAAVWEMFLPLPDSWGAWLRKTRGWTEKAISRLDIRMQTHYRAKNGDLVKIKKTEGIAIPIRNEHGDIVNIRIYKPQAKVKIMSWGKGFGSSRMFPAKPLNDDGYVLLCEGESDTICAISHGLNAITQTSKTKKFKDDHLRPFKGRDVVICYDADRPGQRYAGYAAESLMGVAKSVCLLEWPDFMGRQNNGEWPQDHGEDLTDFFVKHGKTFQDFQDLVAKARLYTKQDGPLSDDSRYRFFANGANGRLSFKPRLLADQIRKDVSIQFDPTTGLLYKWNGQFWDVYAETHIESRAIDYLGDEAQKSRVKDASFLAITASSIPHGRAVNDHEDLVCLNNGEFNLETIELTPHNPDHLFTFKLDVSFDPKNTKKCDRWLEFLRTNVQTPEAIKQLQEFAGYCLTRDTHYQKALLLLGPGSDGKTKFLNILAKIVGHENMSAISFRDLEDQFQRAALYNKLLNVSTEIGHKAMESQFFKAIVTGDPISAAFKHKDSFSFNPFVKLAFASNKLPKVLDNSDGFYRRLLIVEFKRQYLEDDPDRDPLLEDKLTAELDGIFEWALIGLHRLREQGRFTQCSETLELIQAYRRLNNPVMCFVEDACVLGDDHIVDRDTLFKEYRTYCSANGYVPFSKENFFRELYAAQSHLTTCRPRANNPGRHRMVKGIDIANIE